MTPPELPGPPSPGPRAKRQALVARIADALLAAGVAQIPLRDLAAQVGSSDRMLLYYFDDKADLVRASLQEVSLRLAATLGAGAPGARIPPAEMIRKVVPLFASPQLGPFMNVWADVTARGGRGEEPFRAIARRSVEDWLAYLEARLDVEDAARRRAVAVAILMMVEGGRMLEASVPGSTQAAAAILSAGLGVSGPR